MFAGQTKRKRWIGQKVSRFSILRSWMGFWLFSFSKQNPRAYKFTASGPSDDAANGSEADWRATPEAISRDAAQQWAKTAQIGRRETFTVSATGTAACGKGSKLNGHFVFIFEFRVDCSESCKLRKQMLENECKQLRRDISSIEELKKSAEQQSRNYEQEVWHFVFDWLPMGKWSFIDWSSFLPLTSIDDLKMQILIFDRIYSYENLKRSWDPARHAKVQKY